MEADPMVDDPRVEELLLQALELAPERRESFLAEACGDDAVLRQEVDSLVRADEQAEGFLKHPFVNVRSAEPDTVGEVLPGRAEAGHAQVLTRFLRRIREGARPREHTEEAGKSRLSRHALIAGRYRVVRFLGRGGMAEVYHAADLKLDEPVALKFLSERLAKDEKMRVRFLREVKIARRVSHPNVCRVFDVGDVDGHLFLSMEFIDGEDLASLLARVGRPTKQEALEIVRQVCRGLAAVHDQGILHRDLKPSNLMIDVLGRVRISDFGIAGVAGSFTGRELCKGRQPTWHRNNVGEGT